jgi:hypothetical protein
MSRAWRGFSGRQAVKLISKATELFLECMAEEAEAYRRQSTTKRRSLTFMDVGAPATINPANNPMSRSAPR